MPPRRRTSPGSRRSTRLRTDPEASNSAVPEPTDVVSSGVADAGASTSAGPSSSHPPPPGDDRLLHLQPDQLRGPDKWHPLVHKPMMAKTPQVDQHLTTLGLIHVVQLGHMPVDHTLVQGLALFWRPETHTFHFPHVGEMTVSLEDVAFLYGLPVTSGRVVTGHCHFDYIELLSTYALPRDTPQEEVEKCFREKDRTKKHCVRFTKLRKIWKDVVLDDEDQIDRYTRAFVLELIGCTLFPDGTGDSVPAFYLDLLRDLRTAPSQGVYNWGAATLAALYRGLDTAAINNTTKIGAPWLLLQVWSYARLTLCRPTITDDFSGWGVPSIDTCAPYGRRWTTRHRSKKYQGPGYSSGMDYARDVLMKIRPEHVHWRPYDHMRSLMPRYAQVDPSLFVVRIPCIHYWMVMWHYADRVMHQFMLYQTVPPPRPEAWQRTSQLMGYMFTTYRNRDWRDVFQTEVGMWGDMTQARVREERPWSDAIEATYLRWLRVHGGAYVVHIPEETETAPVADMSYLRDSPAHVALVKHTLRDVLRACAWAVKKGFRRAGKTLLTSCSTTLDLVGEPHRIPHVLESKGLPTDIASIPDTSSDEEELPEPGWDEHRFMQFV
ncbi:hypothetical protein LUZ61_012261 [Rhynchospora tenuis]|uniref:Aminotransferase-like plant mobile domain-containing protein n=1 Tax=Rhynchospora tenuis TaxID=198213 RepID=A0AAD6A2K5_9POAL|nr:hypothetical protein LUZ61_012261 [Rhynchospora tenuis]